MESSSAVRRARSEGFAVALAVSAYGVSFGALSVAAGLDIWQTCVLSLVMFTGGSQFAFIGVIASGGLTAAPAALVSAVLLSARNAAYSMRMAPILDVKGPKKLFAAHITIDESTAVALAQPDKESSKVGFWVTGVAIYVGWNVTTLVGAFLGEALGDVRAYGLDAAAAAAFLALLWPRLVKKDVIAIGVVAAVIATVVTPVVMPGLQVLIAGLVAIVASIFLRDRKVKP